MLTVHPWDTDGAARSGLGTVWINRAGGIYPGYFQSPDLMASSLGDLAEQLH